MVNVSHVGMGAGVKVVVIGSGGVVTGVGRTTGDGNGVAGCGSHPLTTVAAQNPNPSLSVEG